MSQTPDAQFERDARIVVRALVGFWSPDAAACIARALCAAEHEGRVKGMREAAPIAGRAHEFGFADPRQTAVAAEDAISTAADDLEKRRPQ
jgi:hypothetical protein